VLISTFDDNAYVRQRLAYELWNTLDPEHLQIQVYSGVVFQNGVYHGLYTFSDHVDGYLMEDHGLDQAGQPLQGQDARRELSPRQQGGRRTRG
jgi:spore coat protein H